LTLIFTKARPKGHYGTGRNAGILKDWALDLMPTGKPDVLKLGRAIEDAMNGVVYLDDSQIVEEHLSKVYGAKPGAKVIIQTFERNEHGTQDRKARGQGAPGRIKEDGSGQEQEPGSW